MEIEVSCFRECDIDTVFEIQRTAYKGWAEASKQITVRTK